MASSGKYIGQPSLRKVYLQGRRDMLQDAMEELDHNSLVSDWFAWAKQAMQTIIGQLYDYRISGSDRKQP